MFCNPRRVFNIRNVVNGLTTGVIISSSCLVLDRNTKYKFNKNQIRKYFVLGFSYGFLSFLPFHIYLPITIVESFIVHEILDL